MSKTVPTLPPLPIAVAQKRVILCLLAELSLIGAMIAAAIVLPPAVLAFLPAVFLALYAILKIAQVVFCWALFASIGQPGALGILTVLGILGLAVLAWGSQEATKALQAQGVRVGFLGVSRSDMDRLRATLAQA